MAKSQVIKDPSSEAALFVRRAAICFCVVLLMAALLVANLYFLQVKRFEDYKTRSDGNRIKVLPVAPNRGLIYDRQGKLLAKNQPVYHLEVIPEQVDELESTLERLKILLDFPDELIENFFDTLKQQRRFKPVTLKKNLDEREVALFSANQHIFRGVFINARLSRHYPHKDVLTHVLGYVARINRQEQQKLEEREQTANYAATHDIGKLGIEKYHEKLLHGKVGYQEVEVNNQGRILRTLTFQEPVPGKDIVLSIDLGLQRAAQQALGNNKGAIVAIDPRDGGVLALYSNPSYDPNLFVDGISRINYRKLLLSPDRPLINRATQGQYPPASTIKPHIGLLGLESNVINMQSRFFDTGEYSLKGSDHVWRDWWRRGHGWVDLTAAVAVSCDTFFYDLAYKLGIDRISQYMAHFGFGKYTGVDLHEEANGNMPSRGWKRATYDEAWYPGDTVIVGIGQGAWTATPLQIAQSISILINGGKVISPQLLRGFNSPEGYQPSPSTLTKRFSVNKHNLDNVLSSMYQVIYSAKGTARNAFKNAPYVSAGKTGTAQLISIAQDEEYDEDKIDERHRDNAMYVGYAPYYKPEIVVAVVMENAGGGGKKAAPVARIIMDHYFSSTLPTKPNSVIDVSEEYADSRL